MCAVKHVAGEEPLFASRRLFHTETNGGGGACAWSSTSTVCLQERRARLSPLALCTNQRPPIVSFNRASLRANRRNACSCLNTHTPPPLKQEPPRERFHQGGSSEGFTVYDSEFAFTRKRKYSTMKESRFFKHYNTGEG